MGNDNDGKTAGHTGSLTATSTSTTNLNNPESPDDSPGSAAGRAGASNNGISREKTTVVSPGKYITTE